MKPYWKHMYDDDISKLLDDNGYDIIKEVKL